MTKVASGTVKSRSGTPTAPAPPTLNLVKPGAGTQMRGVLFGPPKTGKTVAAVSGEGRKLLVLTEPDGDLSLVGRDDVDVVKPKDKLEIQGVLRALHSGEVANYDRVVFDSVSFMFELVGGEDINKTFEANKDIRRAYGKAGGIVAQMIHDAMALPTDVIVLSQLKLEQSDEGDEPLNPLEGEHPVTLAITPMVYRGLVPAVSFIGRTYKKMIVGPDGNKRVQYLVSFEDYGRSPAGARVPLPAVVENLNLDDVKATLQGATNGNS